NHFSGGNFTLSDGVVECLLEDPTLDIAESIDLEWALGELREGRVAAVLHFPADYTAGRILLLADSTGSPAFDKIVDLLGLTDAPKGATLYADRANTQVYAAVSRAIGGAFLSELRESNATGGMVEFFEEVAVYGEDAEFIDFFAPGIMVIATTMITIILTIISFVRERNMGTLARLFSSPMTAGELVAGYALGFGIISACQSLELLGVGLIFFQIQISGSIILSLALIFALAFGVLGLGILLSTLAKNEFQAVQFVPLVLIPSIVLSGVFWPVEAMPPAFRDIPAFIPMTHAVNGLRSVMVRGWTLRQVAPELIILCAFAAGTLGLSVLVMGRKARAL
ncbi:MAG: ABC transporter permease, partial [Theionarchaea archaeon]|nr:ABC transporter permease [Theionarchaea archaeon]